MRTTLLVLALSLAALGCGGSEKDASTLPATSSGADNPCGANPCAGAEKSLYDRLGGVDAIRAVVDEFVARVASDTRINKFFAKTDIGKLKKLLVDQICEATGGPCKYAGRSMKEAHAGMGVTEADFNALVEDLVGALDKFHVPEKEKNELLSALGGMKGDIVGQ